MVQTSISQILEQLANALVSIGAAWLLMHMVAGADSTRQAQLGAMGSALGTGAGVLIALIFVFMAYRKHRASMQDEIAEDQSELEPYGRLFLETIMVITPFMLSGFILNLTTSLNQTIYYRIMIQMKQMEAIASTTLYGIFSNKAVVISNIPISVATAVSAAIIPGISASFARGDKQETRRKATNATRITAMVAIPSAVGLAIMAKPITMLMFPQMASLDQAALLLALLSVTVVFYSVSTVTNAALQAIGRMNMPLVSAMIALVIQTGVLFLLLIFTDLGIYALVIVSVLYSALIFVVNEFWLKKYLGLKRNYVRIFLQPLGCALIMGGNAWAIYELLSRLLEKIGMERLYFINLFAALPALLVAVVVYAFLLVRLSIMTKENILALPKGKKLVRILKKLHWLH